MFTIKIFFDPKKKKKMNEKCKWKIKSVDVE